ncbi:MAG: ABC transporter ATP-binding protein [Clostridia bacterium]|nr:ABC transporter ATP-binding protein [Clostridia bacterium]
MKKKNKKEGRSIKKIFKNNLYMLGEVFRYAPDYPIIKMTRDLIDAAGSIYFVYFTKLLYDAYSTTGAGMRDIFAVILPFLCFQIIDKAWSFVCYYILEPKAKNRLQFRMQEKLYRKARSMDISCYDDPEFYNAFVWAMSTADTEALGTVDKISSFISGVINVVGVVGIMATIEPIIMAIIAVCVICSFLIKLLGGKLKVVYQNAENPVQRRKEYSIRVFYLAEYAKELRMSNIADKVLEDYEKTLEEHTRVIYKYGKPWIALNVGSWLSIEAPMEIGVTLLLIWRVMGGRISLGDYASVTNAIWQVFYTLRRVIDSISEFAVSSLFIDKYRTFIEYENKIVDGTEPLPVFESLRLRGVEFAYPSNEDNTLNGIDLEIRRGEKIAIVGYNGAGKTTLIKLLMRLYDPNGGLVEYNGRDIREFKLEEYRANFGTIFQDYKVFAATVAENVLGGECGEKDRETVFSALRRATFEGKLDELPHGIDSNLTREFDEEGINLSGGEAQKIAIARAFARDCDLIIMDEPSSALDPISEYELNHSIKDNAEDKTVIFISHRLSTTRMADRIYMFEDGRIVEHGSHDELMKANGQYARMFDLQAEKYQTKA